MNNIIYSILYIPELYLQYTISLSTYYKMCIEVIEEHLPFYIGKINKNYTYIFFLPI